MQVDVPPLHARRNCASRRRLAVGGASNSTVYYDWRTVQEENQSRMCHCVCVRAWSDFMSVVTFAPGLLRSISWGRSNVESVDGIQNWICSVVCSVCAARVLLLFGSRIRPRRQFCSVWWNSVEVPLLHSELGIIFNEVYSRFYFVFTLDIIITFPSVFNFHSNLLSLLLWFF